MELLVALIVVSMIILYFFAIEKIGRQDLLNADHRTKVQNNVSYVLDHMTTNIKGRMGRGGAIGNMCISPYPVDTTSGISGCNNAIKIYIDSNNNGKLDPGTGPNDDKQIAYCYSPTPNYQIWYYSNYTDYPSTYEVITGNRTRGNFSYNTSDPTYVACIRSDTSQPTACSNCSGSPYCNNYLDVQITGCWEPGGATLGACDSANSPNPNNPSVTMHAYINMPSVSTN